jgi:hypothetical protein
MHDEAPRPRRRLSPYLGVAVLLAVGFSASAAIAASNGQSTNHANRVPLAGTWSGKYSGAFSGTFTLHWTQSGTTLKGSITLSSPHGTYTINGSVKGSAIKFGAVGAGATYKGSVSGKSMSGTYKSPRGGGSWSAHKTS